MWEWDDVLMRSSGASCLPITSELSDMSTAWGGWQKMISMLTPNLGKFETRWTLDTWRMESSCQKTSPSGLRRNWCLFGLMDTTSVWRWRPKGLCFVLFFGNNKVTFFFGSVWLLSGFVLSRELVMIDGVRLSWMLSRVSSPTLLESSASLSEEVWLREK